MKHNLFDTISNEEYEQIRQAAAVLGTFLKKYKDTYSYDEIVVSPYGMTLRRDSIEFMAWMKTREEDKADTEALIKEWTENG